MAKPDKYPFLDPNVRGIFPRIIEAVAIMRKEQRSSEWLQQQKREEQARGDRLKLMEREVKDAAERLERERRAQQFMLMEKAYIPLP